MTDLHALYTGDKISPAVLENGPQSNGETKAQSNGLPKVTTAGQWQIGAQDPRYPKASAAALALKSHIETLLGLSSMEKELSAAPPGELVRQGCILGQASAASKF